MNNRFNGAYRRFSTFLAILLTFLFINNNKAFAADGAKLFKQNCAVCHSLGKNKVTGPGLEGVMARVPSEDWLKKWIKNNKTLINAGDAYAVSKYKEYGTDMTIFDFLSDDDIVAIIETVKKGPIAVPTTGPTTTTTTGTPPPPVETSEKLYILLGVVIFLIILISVLRTVKRSLKNIQNQKEGKPQLPDTNIWQDTKNWIWKNKTFFAVILIALSAWGSKIAWYDLKDIGVFEGYQPTQPIAFSHKLHAGDNQINCQYCHNGAERSKTAGIPTVNVCMNCHKGISSGPTTGTKEIAKIYEAAGWDPAKGAYTNPQKPIQWVKVHNLPDFVWFSHQQHVKVGKQDCANCHGAMNELTVARQNQPLTMGWCIDCHRKTEVPGMVVDKATGAVANPYYEELHKKLAAKYKNEKITVEKMGGIECGKCHY